jgi:outer membrane protein OmpA-like peptidoglycan-associated protein
VRNRKLRNKLAVQLNSILQTKDSARGLIVNMSDILFARDSIHSNPAHASSWRIVLAYPSLAHEVEGHTDSVGTDDLNLRLSENRANSVRDFLIGQGIVRSSIGSHGYGASQPVATNDTATGRQQNRRVELVVSGEVIGAPIGAAVEAKPQR